MASPTAQSLVRELAIREGEFYLSAPTVGTTLTLTDPGLSDEMPADVPFNSNTGQGAHWWVYGAADADAANRGIERRVRSWAATPSVATFGVAWPTAIGTGHYEFHFRTRRSRKLEAINSAIRALGFAWYRHVVDVSTTSVNNQWQYTLPSTVLWKTINKVTLQISTNSGLVGFPYQDMSRYDYDIWQQTDSGTGVTTWILQFASMPPPGRTIRIFGEAEYADLVADTDLLPIPATQQGRAVEFIYELAQARLAEWEANKQPQGEGDKYLQMWQAKLSEAKEELMRFAPSPEPWRVVTPGRGEGLISSADDPHYFGAFQMLH